MKYPCRTSCSTLGRLWLKLRTSATSLIQLTSLWVNFNGYCHLFTSSTRSTLCDLIPIKINFNLLCPYNHISQVETHKEHIFLKLSFNKSCIMLIVFWGGILPHLAISFAHKTSRLSTVLKLTFNKLDLFTKATYPYHLCIENILQVRDFI